MNATFALALALGLGWLVFVILDTRGRTWPPKNMDRGWWIASTLIFGVLTIPFYLRARKRASGRDEKKCPECAEWVKGEANVCRFCSHQFGPAY